MAALQRGDRQLEALRDQVLEHRQDAAVDLAGGDVFAAAFVDVEALVGEDPLLQRLLGEQQDAGAAEVGGEAGSCPWRGRSPSPRAASSRRGSASGRSAARRVPAGRIEKLMWGSTPSAPPPIRASTVPAITFEPTLRVPSAPLAAGAVDAVALGLRLVARCGAARAAREPRPQVLAVDRDPLLLAGRHHHRAVVADDLAELGVGVAVAVGVFEDDELAELRRVADLADHAVVDGDDRRALRRRRC